VSLVARSLPDASLLPRRPRQARAIDRCERVLDAAESLLEDTGLAGFSIPQLAERLGYPRATIYKFFPTPYAVVNELARRHLDRLEAELNANAARIAGLAWPQAVEAMVALAAAFYERHPVARIVILGGPLTDASYRAQELTIQRLGGLARGLLAHQGIVLPRSPDVAMLAVELGTSTFRLSHFLHGRITPEYRAEAARAMVAYLRDRLAGEQS
jgi:AcrR family transcriptional regulator